MLILLLAGMLGCQADDPARQVEYVRLSYKANKDAFAFGTFRFKCTRATCVSLEDAKSEVYSRSITEDGFYAFDGQNARFELTAEPKDVAAVTKWIDEHRSSTLASTFRMLTDGKVTFMDLLHLNRAGTVLLHQPQIFPDTVFYRQTFEFPLFLGDDSARPYDLFSSLTLIKEGKVSLAELDLDARMDGVKVCKISFNHKSGKRTYWVDLNRGAVPLRILNHYNPTNRDSHFIFDDLVQVPNAGWLPRRMLHITGNGGSVRRVVVTNVDVQNRPSLSVFQLDFPKPISLHDRARKLVYSRRKTWSLLNLPSRSSPGTRSAIPIDYIPPAELPGEIEPGPPWVIIVSASMSVVLVLGSILVLRRRKKRLRGA